MIDNTEIERYFNEQDVASVRKLLSTYTGNEGTRVQRAILDLAKGSIDGIKYHIECAQKDYRDVLYWSEYPDKTEETLAIILAGMTVNERLFHLNISDDFYLAIAAKDEFKLRKVLNKCLIGDESINAIIKFKLNT